MLTRPPLAARIAPALPLDLHVLGTPPAFNLSQDQTLHLEAFDLSSDDQIPNNSLLAIEYSSSICASQTTDASPHTNYLFSLLKSDLHAGRRQKRNSNRDLRSVNPSEVSGSCFSRPGEPSCERLPVRRPRSLMTDSRESTPVAQLFFCASFSSGKNPNN